MSGDKSPKRIAWASGSASDLHAVVQQGKEHGLVAIPRFIDEFAIAPELGDVRGLVVSGVSEPTLMSRIAEGVANDPVVWVVLLPKSAFDAFTNLKLPRGFAILERTNSWSRDLSRLRTVLDEESLGDAGWIDVASLRTRLARETRAGILRLEVPSGLPISLSIGPHAPISELIKQLDSSLTDGIQFVAYDFSEGEATSIRLPPKGDSPKPPMVPLAGAPTLKKNNPLRSTTLGMAIPTPGASPATTGGAGPVAMGAPPSGSLSLGSSAASPEVKPSNGATPSPVEPVERSGDVSRDLWRGRVLAVSGRLHAINAAIAMLKQQGAQILQLNMDAMPGLKHADVAMFVVPEDEPPDIMGAIASDDRLKWIPRLVIPRTVMGLTPDHFVAWASERAQALWLDRERLVRQAGQRDGSSIPVESLGLDTLIRLLAVETVPTEIRLSYSGRQVVVRCGAGRVDSAQVNGTPYEGILALAMALKAEKGDMTTHHPVEAAVGNIGMPVDQALEKALRETNVTRLSQLPSTPEFDNLVLFPPPAEARVSHPGSAPLSLDFDEARKAPGAPRPASRNIADARLAALKGSLGTPEPAQRGVADRWFSVPPSAPDRTPEAKQTFAPLFPSKRPEPAPAPNVDKKGPPSEQKRRVNMVVVGMLSGGAIAALAGWFMWSQLMGDDASLLASQPPARAVTPPAPASPQQAPIAQPVPAPSQGAVPAAPVAEAPTAPTVPIPPTVPPVPAPAEAPPVQAAAPPEPTPVAPAPAREPEVTPSRPVIAPEDRVVAVAAESPSPPGNREAVLRAALQADPDDHHALIELAELLIQRNQAAEALPLAEHALRRRPNRPDYLVVVGDAHRALGDRGRAGASYRRALSFEASHSGARRRLLDLVSD